jgi:hypothetical protein
VIAAAVPVTTIAPGASSAAALSATTAPAPSPWAIGAGGAFANRRSVAGIAGFGRGALGTRTTVCAWCFVCHLKLQSAFARAVSDGLHATMVTVTCPVEHYLAVPGCLCLLGQ